MPPNATSRSSCASSRPSPDRPLRSWRRRQGRDDSLGSMSEPKILTERRGHILLIGLNRPEKRNAADFELLSLLADAYGELERDPELRVGLVHAVGDHFTAGLDLADLGPRIGADGLSFVGENGVDPWQVSGHQLTKPVVIAVQGTCLTLGIELMLASDVVVAAAGTR